MKRVSEQHGQNGRAHLPTLRIRCLRTGPRRASGAVAARQPLCLRRGHSRAALRRNFLWLGWRRIGVKQETYSIIYKSSEGEITARPFNLHHKRFRCKAARAQPCPKNNARRAAMASHTHFFRRKKAARRAHRGVRLGAGVQVWCSVGQPQATFTRTASHAGLRPLGYANSPRVLLKERSPGPQSHPH